MKRQHRAFQSLKTFIFAAIVLGVGSSSARAAEGHGGGAGHTVGGVAGRGGFYGGRGYGGYGYGGYGRGYGYGWGGGWGWGLGLGVGLGLGYAYGYPYYDPYYVYPNPGYYPGYAPPNGGPPVTVPVPGSTPQQVGVPGGDATLSVRAPADATIWINGQKTTQTGSQREFVSSGLMQGRSYTFDVRAQWKGPDGRPVDIEQRIPMLAGERRTVDFGVPSSRIDDVAPVVAH